MFHPHIPAFVLPSVPKLPDTFTVQDMAVVRVVMERPAHPISDVAQLGLQHRLMALQGGRVNRFFTPNGLAKIEQELPVQQRRRAERVFGSEGVLSFTSEANSLAWSKTL